MVSDMVRFKNVLLVAEKKGVSKEIRQIIKDLGPDLLADKQSRKRQPRLPAPPGGISIRAAARKHKIAKTTIQQWVKKEYVSTLRKDDWETFIDEARLAKLAKAYHSDPGRGSWAVKKLILEEQSSS